MGALLPLIGKAAATTATTAVPASMAGTYFAGASGATAGLANALNAGITAGSALGGGGSLAALTPGIFAKAAPALGGLQAGTTIPTAFNAATPFANAASGLSKVASAGANAPLVGGSKLAGQAGNISNQMYDQLVQQFGRPGVGQNLTQLGPNLAGPADTASLTSKFGLETAGVKPGLKMPTELYRGQVTPDMAFKTMGDGASGLLPPAARLTPSSPIIKGENFLSNLGNLIQNPSMDAAGDYIKEHPMATAAAGLGAYQLLKPKQKAPEQDVGSIRPYEFTRTQRPEAYAVSPLDDTSERMYFDSKFTPLEPYAATSPRAKEIEKIAGGGIASAYAVGGPVETMSAMNAVGGNMQYPQAGLQTALYSNPLVQRPEAVNVISPGEGPAVGAYTGEQKFAEGGISDLGGYSDGGRLLRGPGDGVSDSIPAVIGKRQPARLADGEFVIPARIVSELGNGSTEAGARKLYAMMERVQNTRKKSIGKKKVAVNSKADKHLPA